MEILDYFLLAESFWEKPTMFGIPFGTLLLIFWIVSQLKGNQQQSQSSRNSKRRRKQKASTSNSESASQISHAANSPARFQITPEADALHRLLCSEIDVITDSIARRLTVQSQGQILGDTLLSIQNQPAGQPLVKMYLQSDFLMIAAGAICADTLSSIEISKRFFPIFRDIANSLAHYRKEYTAFTELQPEAVHIFFSFYQVDEQPLGFQSQQTYWAGLNICCNVARSCDDTFPLNQYEQLACSLSHLYCEASDSSDPVQTYWQNINSYIDNQRRELIGSLNLSTTQKPYRTTPPPRTKTHKSPPIRKPPSRPPPRPDSHN